MKRLMFALALPVVLLLSSMSGCEKDEEETTPPVEEMLHVEYINEASSQFSITVIQLRPHGVAGTADSPPIGDWTSNILPAGTVLAPGDMHIMDLPIPNTYWSEYRLGVIDADGNEIMLHEQEGWPEQDGPPITHWGGDKRQVYTLLSFNESTDMIYIQGWGDNAY